MAADTPKPTIESLTVKHGTMEVTVTRSTISIQQTGPRGGKHAVAEFTNVSAAQLVSLLKVGQEHQRLLQQFIDGGPLIAGERV